jgi:tetratricopeptide (TPR) repeat protein
VRAIGVICAIAIASAAAISAADVGTANPVELNNRGVLLARQAQFADAEACYRSALDLWSRMPNQQVSVRDRGHTLENLGSLLRDTGRSEEGETDLREALAQLEESAGKSSQDVGEALENIAVLYRAQGDRDKAEAAALRADSILVEPEHTNNRVLLGAIYNEERRFAEARAMLEPVLSGATGTLAFVANANLAAVALGERKLDEAERFAKAAMDFAGSGAQPSTVGMAALYNNLGQLYRFQQRYEEAERAYRKAIDLWTAVRGAAHPYLGDGLLNFAAFEHERGRDRAAEDLYRRSAEIFEHALGADALETLVARNELGEVLRAERRYVAAQQLSRSTLAVMEKKLAEDDPRLQRARSNYARLMSETKRASNGGTSRGGTQ